jgi:hypothetical protein
MNKANIDEFGSPRLSFTIGIRTVLDVGASGVTVDLRYNAGLANPKCTPGIFSLTTEPGKVMYSAYINKLTLQSMTASHRMILNRHTVLSHTKETGFFSDYFKTQKTANT